MIKVRNTTASEIVLLNVLLRETGENDDTYEIPSLLVPQWADDDTVLTKIADGSVVLSLNDVEVTSVSDAIDLLKGSTPKQVSSASYPFAQKVLPDGSKVFTRVHGIKASVQNAPDNIDFVVPYAKCKITGMEIIGCGEDDKVNFKILDSDSGVITGVPNYQLNQFGFSVYMKEGSYKHDSPYDADLVQGLIIRLEYDAKDELLPKNIYVNIFLHEVVTS